MYLLSITLKYNVQYSHLYGHVTTFMRCDLMYIITIPYLYTLSVYPVHVFIKTDVWRETFVFVSLVFVGRARKQEA